MFNPYRVNERGQQINKYYFDFRRMQLARMMNANINANFELNPKARTRPETAPHTNLQHLSDHPLAIEYVDFDIPWTLSVQATVGVFPSPFPNQPTRSSASLGLNGTLGLTEKWQVMYSSGYDFINKNITFSNINIRRDLHCWDMSFSWVPFGAYQMYSFNINAKAALLRDMKYNRNRNSRDL
jgi:hypothetical protein